MLRTEMTGKVAVVTAGAGVIGEVICKTFAASGAAVAVCDKDLAAAQKVAGVIAAAGGNSSDNTKTILIIGGVALAALALGIIGTRNK
jgi:2-hydroxycyclohexanecarboxyl-CoA dehydrogenase